MVNKPLIRPYFWGGYVRGGGWLTSHNYRDSEHITFAENHHWQANPWWRCQLPYIPSHLAPFLVEIFF